MQKIVETEQDWKDAAIQVLADADRPMSSAEIGFVVALRNDMAVTHAIAETVLKGLVTCELIAHSADALAPSSYKMKLTEKGMREVKAKENKE